MFSPDATIRCSTQCFSPNHMPPYDAVSYAWGDPTPRRTIFVDGKLRMVAENLWQFLKHACCSVRGLLWIDALSIDQSNAEERTHQIGIMASIFGNTRRVVVWLSPSASIARAMASLKAQTSWRDRSKVSDVLSLCELPYWRRLWVFQELRHAEKIDLLADNVFAPWSILERLWIVETSLHSLMGSADDVVERERPGRETGDTSTAASADAEKRAGIESFKLAASMINSRSMLVDTPLWSLLHETRNLLCADKRDKVYAILSVTTSGHVNIEADYHATVHSMAHDVLRNRYSITPPTTIDEIVLDCKFLEGVFDMPPESMFQCDDCVPRLAPARTVPNDKERSWCGSKWISCHGHSAVRKLLEPDLPKTSDLRCEASPADPSQPSALDFGISHSSDLWDSDASTQSWDDSGDE